MAHIIGVRLNKGEITMADIKNLERQHEENRMDREDKELYPAFKNS